MSARLLRILPLVAALFLVATCAADKRKKMSSAGLHGRFELTDAERRALTKYDRDFFVTGCRESAYQEELADAAFTVHGDFDGDGSRDLAVLGMTDSHRALLALFCAGEQCKVVEVERWPRGARAACEGRLFLTIETPGVKRSPREARSLNLKHDAVRIYYDQAAQAILYYRDGGFYSYIMHD
jgi:hypothetical protein